MKDLLDKYDQAIASQMTTEMFTNPVNYLTLPLVRIKLDYSGGYKPPNLTKFVSQFEGKLANPKDFLKFV